MYGPRRKLLTFKDSAGKSDVAAVQAYVSEDRMIQAVNALGTIETGVVAHTRSLTITRGGDSDRLRPNHRVSLPGIDSHEYTVTEIRQKGSQLILRIESREKL